MSSRSLFDRERRILFRREDQSTTACPLSWYLVLLLHYLYQVRAQSQCTFSVALYALKMSFIAFSRKQCPSQANQAWELAWYVPCWQSPPLRLCSRTGIVIWCYIRWSSGLWCQPLWKGRPDLHIPDCFSPSIRNHPNCAQIWSNDLHAHPVGGIPGEYIRKVAVFLQRETQRALQGVWWRQRLPLTVLSLLAWFGALSASY